MQGGTGASPCSWATLQSWLDRRSMHGVLLVFENSEDMLQDDDTMCEVLHAFQTQECHMFQCGVA